ncbi:MAG: hypothetical protein WBE34_13315 [Candidatus Nitrosopolaris sp.]
MNIGSVVPSLILFNGVDNKAGVVAPELIEKLRFFNTENANNNKSINSVFH